MQENESDVHPTHDLLEQVATKALTVEEVRNGFPALWAHLQECEECFAAFKELLRLAHEEGHREGHSEESETRRAVVLTAVAGLLAIALLAGGFLWWQQQASEETNVNRIYARMSPAVANIQVKSAGVTGSGLVFDKNGYVVTNYHVVNEAVNDEDIVVQLPGLGQVPARLVGYDIATDLAVLKVDAPPDRLTVAEFGNSDAVQVGDLAIVIGNPFGLSHSLTVGHISAVARRLMSNDMYAPDVAGVLQTDAAINPGNSGGPLFNRAGQVIGINTRIESPSGGSVGLGFAIPSNTVRRVAEEIIARGYVRRPFLGAGGRPVDATLAHDLGLPVEYGLLVQEVYPGSPAERAGLRAGDGPVQTTYGSVQGGADVILALDGQPVRNQSDLNELVAQHDVGDKVKLDILRNGRQVTIEATLTERPLRSREGT
ncbi:MAG: PDZ domain-containing protein [Chloroflexi bacterium]|nr:MAG: PDZ domain-containing protein [Chloroflexota bacterium]